METASLIRTRPTPPFDNSQTDPFTLSAWIMSQQHSVAPEARGRLTILLHAITVGCKFVASAVRKVR